MKIHEYQAKDILARHGIPVQPGRVAYTPQEAETIARELGGPAVIKAQVYVGGRGKAGGIQFGDTPEQARAAASRVLGMDIKGLKVEKVLVTSKIDIKEEYYSGYYPRPQESDPCRDGLYRWRYRYRRSCCDHARKDRQTANRYALGAATL